MISKVQSSELSKFLFLTCDTVVCNHNNYTASISLINTTSLTNRKHLSFKYYIS